MRTETYTRNIYEYDELSDEAKKTAKDYLSETIHDIDEFEFLCSEDIKANFPNSQLQMDFEFNGYRSEDYFTLLGKLCLFDVVEDLKYQNKISSDEYDTIRYCFDRYEYDDFVELNGEDDYAESIDNNIENVIWYLKQEYENGNQPTFDDPTVPEASSEDVLIDTLNKLKQLCIDYVDDFISAETQFGKAYFEEEMDDEEMQEICDANEYEFNEDGTLV